MYKVIIKPSEFVFRSYDIYEVYKYLLEHKGKDYIFLKDYVVFSISEFIEHFLVETEEYKLVKLLENALNKNPQEYKYLKQDFNVKKEKLTIFNYIEKWQKNGH